MVTAFLVVKQSAHLYQWTNEVRLNRLINYCLEYDCLTEEKSQHARNTKLYGIKNKATKYRTGTVMVLTSDSGSYPDNSSGS